VAAGRRAYPDAQLVELRPRLVTARVAAVVAAVAPKPVNLLVGGASELTVDDYAALGVRRISVGGGLALVAWSALIQAATRLAEAGSFDGMLAARPAADLNALFREDLGRRTP
jgi:2-methylisocitrate lyase-like PEP mutase family enzyme